PAPARPAVAAARPAAPPERPNLLVILADDLGTGDLGAYGNPAVKTPHLDRLARSGLRFDRAFLTISSCSPSRCSLLTGRYPHATGAGDSHDPLPASQTTVAETLRAAGYYTAAVGKWHLGDDAVRRFDRVIRDAVRSGCENWVGALRDRPKDRPFFFWFAASDAHRPFDPTPFDRYDPAAIPIPPFLPEVKETRIDLARYYGEITRLDDYVGRLLAELDRQNETARTLVVFLSDDGSPFPRCKNTLYDSGLRTPLLARLPGTVRPGGTCAGLVSAVDLAPTLLDLAGLKPPASMQGRSFAALLRDPAARARDEVFAEQNWHDYAARQRMVRTARHKYIRNLHPAVPLTPPVDVLRSPTFQAMRRLRERGLLAPDHDLLFVKPRPAEELYDLESDPHELRNLAADPGSRAILADLRARLDRWRRDTGDHDGAPLRADESDRETGEPLPGARHWRHD
ncbi:MAG: sulfatase family protein, partial [Candidatus Polarisedimenticolia bacterium]